MKRRHSRFGRFLHEIIDETAEYLDDIVDAFEDLDSGRPRPRATRDDRRSDGAESRRSEHDADLPRQLRELRDRLDEIGEALRSAPRTEGH
ncbi:hypothetical protein [Streptomyces sp. NPDC046887]|uniref:hypothetical protein n=1 Tax=Streptomyces sp. NPDC046887 TaxID=3155472 RepID=UPI0033C5497A